MSNAIEIRGLGHRYNGRTIYENLNFSVPEGSVCGLLGKNGQGKTTLVNILMGFLKPFKGECLVLGEDSHDLPPAVRARIGLLHEGHLAYEFMTIAQTERFYRGFYPRWNPEMFFGLVNKMGLSLSHKVGNMSCGQRSQVVLGVIMAQDPDLLILDDYSMGLDAGYRRLFLDVLHDFAAKKGKTIFVTSHIVQDLEQLVDTIIFIDRGEIMQVGLEEFMTAFNKYVFHCENVDELPRDDIVKGFERRGKTISLYSYADIQAVERHLAGLGVQARDLSQASMSLEDGFIGLMGKY
ncbi:ABC transporter ATP-binding protein [Desulfonatronum sp. SC1]|jgi:ABC-2 type transport system ATP-binding protein|uniref:ABC transporter ATP-binding protein n=1 Tax=Desulfonatronum sp. SC1 TaxID=2109626 RepID=UPI000D2FF01C|nr:ABC transporter ATP-binding protein [Desulfonatronum sp. SC1]PTN38759.1 ABC transporter ATP-binding protein [Desulfonatronum sp. SC1]